MPRCLRHVHYVSGVLLDSPIVLAAFATDATVLVLRVGVDWPRFLFFTWTKQKVISDPGRR